MSTVINRAFRRFKKPEPKDQIVVQPIPSSSTASSLEITQSSEVEAPAQPSLAITYEPLDVSGEANPLLAEAKKQYNQAITIFDETFALYVAKNPNVMKLDSNGIAKTTRRALCCEVTSQSGKI